jgi:hypothetical protein
VRSAIPTGTAERLAVYPSAAIEVVICLFLVWSATSVKAREPG